eukprot:TRINITY_DN14955_c1_g1_i1.p1 TRINITY_DN14955_c1_g1~~TRINITY_DN14955_c1_g1_i1.p1  ORF type:complete len:239 (+),score=42.59 TRINITY_DN14955_c1_g1_i1:64-780(+)
MSAYYVQQPDGSLSLQYGAPPAGLRQVGSAPMSAALPTAASLVATPQMGQFGGYAPQQTMMTAPSMVATPQPGMFPTAQSMVVTGPQQPQYTSSLAAGAFGATHAVGNAITGAGSMMADGTGAVVHGAGNLASGAVSGVGSGVGYATHAMGNAVSGFVPESVSNVTGGVVHGAGNIVSGVTEGLGNATGAVTKGIGDGITGAGSAVSNVFAAGERAVESNFQKASKKTKKKKSSGWCC